VKGRERTGCSIIHPIKSAVKLRRRGGGEVFILWSLWNRYVMSFNEKRLNYFASSCKFMNELKSVNTPVVVYLLS
jgi:hypothetical protein